MRLAEIRQKIKGFFWENRKWADGALLLGIIVSGAVCLNNIEEIRAQNALRMAKLKVYAPNSREVKDGSLPAQNMGEISQGTYVASALGNTYYRRDCAGVRAIHDENLLSFSSQQAAEEAGFMPAKNCLGDQ